MTPMMESFRNWLWRFGLWLRNLLKRRGLLGPLERHILRLAPRFIPAPVTDTRVVLPTGATLVVPAGFPSGRSYLAGSYELDVSKVFREVTRDASYVVDVGANIGYYTLLASDSVGGNGCVFSFEPDEAVFEHLEANIAANALTNVIAVNQAISDAIGHKQFSRDQYGVHGHLAGGSPQSDSLMVCAITLDAFLEEVGWPIIDVVKMDVEGGESQALFGMQESAGRSPGLRLIVEYDETNLKRSGSSREEFKTALIELGFRTGFVIERDMEKFDVGNSFPRSADTLNLLLMFE